MTMPDSTMRVRLAVFALAAVSFVASFAIAGWMFPHMSANNDEAVYVTQAEAIEAGSFTLPAAPYADFFRPWMSGPQGDRQVLVFQPVFPLTLALSDKLFGTMRVAPAAIAAAGVLLMFAFVREITKRDRVALLSALLFALSPLTLVHSGMYLEYLYAVVLELAVLLLVLRAEHGRTTRRLVAAGLIHGVLFFMRPFDAIVLGAVVVIMQVLPRRTELATRTQLARGARAAGTVAAAACGPVALCFLYNHHVTGHFLRFPLWAIGGSNELGFGDRTITAGAPVIHYGFNDASIAIRQNLRSFPHWLAGGVLAVPVGALGLWQLRRNRAFAALVAIALLYPLGYMLYWGNVLIVFGRRTIGPHYYLALLIPACCSVAAGLDRLFEHGRKTFAVCVAALLVATAIEVPDKIDRNREIRDRINVENDAIVDTLATAPARDAIVVLPVAADGPYVMHPRGWLRNPVDLAGPVLYAADRGAENFVLFERFGDRAIWRFQSGDRDGTQVPDMRPLHEWGYKGETVNDVTVRNTPNQPVIVFHVSTGAQTVQCVIDRAAVASTTHVVRLRFTTDAVALPCDGGELSVPFAPSGTLAIGAAFGPNDNTGFSQVHEYRAWYRKGEAAAFVVPAEQWRREPAPTQRWRVTFDNPAIAMSLLN